MRGRARLERRAKLREVGAQAGERRERRAAIDQQDRSIDRGGAPAPHVTTLGERPDLRGRGGLGVEQTRARVGIDHERAVAAGDHTARWLRDELAEGRPALQSIEERGIARAVDVPRLGAPPLACVRDARAGECARDRDRLGHAGRADRAAAGAADRPRDDARERICIREQRQPAAEIDDALDARLAREQLAQRPAVRCGHPLVRDDQAIAPAGTHDPVRELDEVDVEIGDAVVARESAQRAPCCVAEPLLVVTYGGLPTRASTVGQSIASASPVRRCSRNAGTRPPTKRSTAARAAATARGSMSVPCRQRSATRRRIASSPGLR